MIISSPSLTLINVMDNGSIKCGSLRVLLMSVLNFGQEMNTFSNIKARYFDVFKNSQLHLTFH